MSVAVQQGVEQARHRRDARIRLLMSSLFVAGLVHLLHGLHLPLETPAHLVVGNLVSHLLAAQAPPDAAGDVAVLEIDRAHFREAYRGTSPLDRCRLQQDIAHLAGRFGQMELLAIDFDLSPVDPSRPDPACPQPGMGKGSAAGTAPPTLLDYLKGLGRQPGGAARPIKTIMILPPDLEDRGEVRAWMDAVAGDCARKLAADQRLGTDQARALAEGCPLALAEPGIQVELGAVRQYEDNPNTCPSLGRAMALARQPDGWLAVQRRQIHCLGEGGAEVRAARDADTETLSIDFHRLMERARLPGYDGQRQERFEDQVRRMACSCAQAGEGKEAGGVDGAGTPACACEAAAPVRQVLLGPGYDRTDEYLTPLGMLSGVKIHAATALSLSSKWEGLNFLIDIALGLVFGLCVHGFWHRYFQQRLGLVHPVDPANAATPTDATAATAAGGADTASPGLAYLWLVGLLLFWLVLGLALLPLLSIAALRWAGLWISPVPMLIGMTVDAFVMGSVQTATQLLPDSAARPRPLAFLRGLRRRHEPTAIRAPLTSLGLALPFLIWLSVVLSALTAVLDAQLHSNLR